MDKLFLAILNMSLTGAFVILAICLARLPLKKAPKIISYCLWAVAGFRLVFPFSIESIFSLIPFNAQAIPADIAMKTIPRIDSGIAAIDNAINGLLPVPVLEASVNPLQIWAAVGTFAWLLGVTLMLIYGVASFIIIQRKMQKAVHIKANIYEADNIKSPFVMGIFAPKIYLPVGLSAREHEYIILHEQTHIKRFDHIVKFMAYFLLCLHWFNPLVWVAFFLMIVDMEMSCDERVLKKMGAETKKDYARSLLSLATDQRIIAGSPLAFGEGSVQERIINILNFRKPPRIIIAAAVVFVAFFSLGLTGNKANNDLPDLELYYISRGELYSLNALRGSYSWLGTEAVSEHPLDSIEHMETIIETDDMYEINLEFTTPPQSCLAKRWSDEHIGDNYNYKYLYEKIEIANNAIALSADDKGYVYEVYATWPQGIVHYSFYIK